MFDLGKIEAEWESLNLKLSDEEIFEIFNSEGATMKVYFDTLKELAKDIPQWSIYSSAERRLLDAVFASKSTPDVNEDMSDEEFEYNWNVYCHKRFKWAEEEYDDFFEYPESERYTAEQKFEIVMNWTCEELRKERKEYEEERVTKTKEKERLRKIREYHEFQDNGKRHLSSEGQKKVVAGSLDIVFNQTRYYYKFFNKKISQETLYYICLYALMNAVKYLCISSKIFYNEYKKISLFRLYIEKSIRDAIIKYLAKSEHTGYREIYRQLQKCMPGEASKWFYLDYEEEKEISTNPFELRDVEQVEYDYISDTSSSEFMRIYHKALDKFDPLEKRVMLLAYDSDGYSILTYQEIGIILGIPASQVATIKKRVIGYLQNDYELIQYKLSLDGHLNTSMLTGDEKRIIDLTVSGLDIKEISEYTGIEIRKLAKIRSNAFKKMSIFEKKKKTQLRKEIQEKEIEKKKKVKRKLKVKKQVNYEPEYEGLPFL